MTCLVFEHRHILQSDEPESLLYRSPLLKTFLNATVDGLFLLTDRNEATPRHPGALEPVALVGPTFFGHPLQLGDVMCEAGVDGAGRYRPALLTLARKLTMKGYLDEAVSDVAFEINVKGHDYLTELGLIAPAAAP